MDEEVGKPVSKSAREMFYSWCADCKRFCKSWLESSAFIGGVQVAALIVGILAWQSGAFQGVTTPAKAESRQPAENAVLFAAVVSEDLTHLQSLHGAVTAVTSYLPGHAKYEEADGVIDSFMVTRVEVLKRHKLTELYLAFFKSYEEFTTTQTVKNRQTMRGHGTVLAAAIDAAKQEIGRNAKRQ